MTCNVAWIALSIRATASGATAGARRDFDNTGDVGVDDLLFLLGTWGPCPKKGDCPEDLDNSGDIGVDDLLVLLGTWGPCP